jgi:hypothetical protein
VAKPEVTARGESDETRIPDLSGGVFRSRKGSISIIFQADQKRGSLDSFQIESSKPGYNGSVIRKPHAPFAHGKNVHQHRLKALTLDWTHVLGNFGRRSQDILDNRPASQMNHNPEGEI